MAILPSTSLLTAPPAFPPPVSANGTTARPVPCQNHPRSHLRPFLPPPPHTHFICPVAKSGGGFLSVPLRPFLVIAFFLTSPLMGTPAPHVTSSFHRPLPSPLPSEPFSTAPLGRDPPLVSSSLRGTPTRLGPHAPSRTSRSPTPGLFSSSCPTDGALRARGNVSLPASAALQPGKPPLAPAC